MVLRRGAGASGMGGSGTGALAGTGFSAAGKVAGAAGYELRWAPNKEFKDYHFATLTTTSFAKDPDYTKSGQKWYVKVRSYKTVNGTKTYSAWSTVKAITL